MSNRSALSFVLGTASAMVLSYCIYFDQKRRSDPEYKKKVHNRRIENDLKLGLANDNSLLAILQLSNETQMQQVLLNAFKLGEQLISQGNINEGLNQLASVLIMCEQRESICQALQNSMPEHLMPLMIRLQELQELQEEDEQSSTHSESSTYQFSTAASSMNDISSIAGTS